MELRDLRLALRRNWIIAVLTVICFGAVGVFAANLPKKEYTAKATLTVNPGTATGAVASANYLLPTFVTVVSTGDFFARVQANVPPSLAQESVTLSATNPSGTGLIEVSAKSNNAPSAAAWATTAANTLITDPAVPVDQLLLRVIQAPGVPTKPSTPKPLPIEAATVLLGIIAAVFVALIAEWIRRSRNNTALTQQRLGAPVLAVLPKVRRLGDSAHRLPTVLSTWQSDFAERAQELRTNVEVMTDGRNLTSIAVVGAEHGEGATTVATMLAVALARVGYQVTLVDADLRFPDVHEQLDVGDTPGLGEIADGEDVTAQRSSVPGLEVLPAGQSSRHPAEVLRVALTTVLDAAAPRRVVIVDCPPLRDAAETSFVLSVCRSSILVMNSRRLRSRHLESVAEQVRRPGGELLGVVVNQHAAGRKPLGRGRRRRSRPRSVAPTWSESSPTADGFVPALSGDQIPLRRDPPVESLVKPTRGPSGDPERIA